MSTSDGATVLVHREARDAIFTAAAAAVQGVGNGGRSWLGLSHRRRKVPTLGGEERTTTGDFARMEVGGDERIWALFTSNPKRKIFQNSPSHRIFRHMYGVLNIGENKN